MPAVPKFRFNVPRQNQAHMLEIFEPTTCKTEEQKIANLRALIRDTEAQLVQTQDHSSHMDFLSSGELIAGLVMETCIGFLDLAGSMLGSINPAAAKVANSGVGAIKLSHTASQRAYGQISTKQAFGQAAEISGNTVLSVADPKSMVGKVALTKTKMTFDATVMVMKQTLGDSDSAERKRDARAFVENRVINQTDLIGEGISQGGASTAGGVMKSLALVGNILQSAGNYRHALETRFDTYLSQRQHNREWVRSQTMMLTRLLAQLRDQLSTAVVELEACRMPANNARP